VSTRKLKPERSVQLLQRPAGERPGVLLVQIRCGRPETSVYNVWRLGHLVFRLEKLGAGPGHSHLVTIGTQPVCSCAGWQLGHRVCRHNRMLTELRKGGKL
jgi:hypothetical protein